MGIFSFIKEILLQYWVISAESFLENSTDAHASWSTNIMKRYSAAFLRTKNSNGLVCDRRIIYLLNHQGMADFMAHDVITQFNGNFLSRLAVGVIFPMTILCASVQNSLWLFRRGSDVKTLLKWIDNQFLKTNTVRRGLVVYPEGTRSGKSDDISNLKTGMIRYAYSRNIPVQIVITKGQLDVFNEKKCVNSVVYPNIRFSEKYEVKDENPRIFYHVGEFIEPKNFGSEKQFVENVCAAFKKSFAELSSQVLFVEGKSLKESETLFDVPKYTAEVPGERIAVPFARQFHPNFTQISAKL